MLWHDFFYFSKGERSGLIVLLTIIVIACTILFFNKTSQSDLRHEMSTVPNVDPLTTKDSVASVNAGMIPVDGSNSVNSGSEIPVSGANSKEASSVSANSAPGTTSARGTSARNTRESVGERVNRLTSYTQPTYVRTEKFAEGTIVELNTADTTTLKKVPGIGSAFANRIVNYRNILRGYYSVTQLSEVYGIDEERYLALKPWFTADPSLINKIEINKIPQDSLQRHPYISYVQARVIVNLRRQKGRLTGWENLQLLNEFTESDKIKLQPYISFE